MSKQYLAILLVLVASLVLAANAASPRRAFAASAATAAPVCPDLSVCPSSMPYCSALVVMCMCAENQIGKYLSITDLQIQAGPRASGTLTLTGLVTSGAPLTFSFGFSAPDKWLTLTSQPGVEIPLGDLFGGSSDLAALMGDARLRLSAIGMSLANPLGFHLAGAVLVGGSTTAFDVVLVRNANAPVGFGIYIDAQDAPQAAFSQFVGALNSHADSKPDFFSLRSLNLQFATAGVQSLPASLAPTTPGATMAQGLTVTAVAQISATASSGIMRTLARLVSDTYTLTLEVPPAPTAASLTLSISDIHISGAVKLTHNNIAIVFPRGATPASVRMQSVLEGVTINGAAVQFSGLAEVDLGAQTSLTLQLSMAGTIPHVFGVQRLSIGDVAGSVTLVPVTPFVAGVSLGATIVLGDLSFEGRFGVNWAVPGKNYCLVKLANGLTLDIFFKAFFGHSFALPASVLSTGFLPGTYFSLAESAVQDDFFSPPVSLAQGIHFNGGVNVFGVGPFELKVDLSTSPMAFAVDAVMPVFKIGACSIRGGKGSSVGPHLAFSSSALSIDLGASVECPEITVSATLHLQESPEQFQLAVSSSLLAGALQVSITASAAVGQPFTFAADVELNFDFWDKVKLFVTLKKDVNELPLPSKCPDSWIARHVGITALCNDVLAPIIKLKAWVNNPHTLDVKVGVSGTLGNGQIEFGVNWDLSISGVGKEIKGQAVICITGTCVHDKISEQLSPLHEVRQAFSNAWNKIKKYL